MQRNFLRYTAQQIKYDLQQNHPAVPEKFRVGAKDRQYQLWERNPLSIYCYSMAVTEQKLDYIHNNPIQEKWQLAMEKLRDVAKQMQEEDERRNQLGLTEEEEAFYEILAKHPNAVQDFDLIKELVQKILAQVKKSASQPDWYKKDDTKAQLQLAVKKVLRFKVKAELQEILDEVMEQAEARYREYEISVA
ncbi:type I restriction enzyme endonuclease domain-containing protein [Pontibacter chitinilyticus]|uniref:type I restriction enzyme endonuclease domain-containing protein n=1 Tax=Pontibacter chitinilyticus TaxID=2674989 RepID=UPI00321BE6F2